MHLNENDANKEEIMYLNENDANNVFIAMPSPSEIDIMSPDVPVLLIEDKQGRHYEGQSGGVCCNHHEATGFVFNIYGAKELGEYLDGPHHNQWCGYIITNGVGTSITMAWTQ